MPPTKTQPSTNRCKAGVSIVDNKMDTMDIDFVHWTCPLVTNNEHTVSIVSIGDQWTFSTFWYVANGRINGRPLNVHWTWSLYTMWRMYTMGTPNRSCCTFTEFKPLYGFQCDKNKHNCIHIPTSKLKMPYVNKSPLSVSMIYLISLGLLNFRRFP